MSLPLRVLGRATGSHCSREVGSEPVGIDEKGGVVPDAASKGRHGLEGGRA